jgi:nucleotide-binding universal stress UspA family protein
MNADLLIPTNGFKGTIPPIEYGAWLAKTLECRILLLGVNEKRGSTVMDEHHPLENVLERAAEIFRQNGVEYTLEILEGDAERVIARKANSGNFITLLGPLGRPLLRQWLLRRSIHHLMEEIDSPILYVPQACLPLKKVLICIGGLGYEVTAEHIAMQMAIKSRAEITLLHVAPPVNFEYPTARVERDHWQHLIETDTPVGRSLRGAMEIAKADGLTAHVKARRGNVIEEILQEVRSDDYDLLCMGSPYSGHMLRQLYAPNVTAEVIHIVGCPVLTARYRPRDGMEK